MARVFRLALYTAAIAIGFALLGTFAGGAAARSFGVRVLTNPVLFPSFSPSISDYVVRCQPSDNVRVSVSLPSGDRASIDHARSRTGWDTQSLKLDAGQSFQFSVTTPAQTSTYVVRCLPSDFPQFTARHTGETEAEWYVITPSGWFTPQGTSRDYLAIFDDNGVPVWWERAVSPPRDAKLLSNGDIVWIHDWGIGGPGAEEHSLDGSLVRSINTVESGMDHHDVQQLPNGNFIAGRTFSRDDVDMSSCGGPRHGKLLDFELQELSPTGALLWSWRASDHIPVSEVAPPFKKWCILSGDVYHWNSVEVAGNDFILSFRNLDAVYRINGTTGDIEWKLGGTPSPESLSVIGDPLAPQSPLDAQHDARILADGSLTVFDDGSGYDRVPRVVRFRIDETARTATLLESIANPRVAQALCCGSARKLPGGDWVTAWGNSSYVTEETGSGTVVFQLRFAPGVFSYRVNPVLPGELSRSALRAGMDEQFPRSP